jgi:putative glutamine amidotransferase
MTTRIAVTPCGRPGDYDAAVRRAGGVPWVPSIAGDDVSAILAQVDGILLTGGEDVDPAFFAETPHSTHEPAEPGRDGFEIDLVRQALAQHVPVLAICRGLQVLNVACGGSLMQDIPSEPGPHEPHSLYPPPTRLAHHVRVSPGSRLAGLLPLEAREAQLPVNSRHHQAARVVGAGLTVTAVAPDGIVEALEVSAHPFCVAVQWHPESFHLTGEFDWLFNGFIAACTSSR